MEEHWHAGYHDAVRILRDPKVLRRSKTPDGVFTFDLQTDGANKRKGHDDRRRDPEAAHLRCRLRAAAFRPAP